MKISSPTAARLPRGAAYCFTLLLTLFSLRSLTAQADNKALDFDGSANYITVGDLGAVEDWTIEFWFKPKSIRNYENIFHSNDLGGNNGIRLEISQTWGWGHLYMAVQSQPLSIVPQGESLSLDWHHLSIVGKKSANTLTVYLDGVEKATRGFPNWPSSFSNFVIGRGFSAGQDRNFNGAIDEFRIWNYAREKNDILADKNTELSGEQDGLLVYYDFNQDFAANPTALQDRSDPENNGTLNGFSPPSTVDAPEQLSADKCEVQIGDRVYGGIVYYIFQEGDIGYEAGKVKGLVAAEEDLPTRHIWGCTGVDIPDMDMVPSTIRSGEVWQQFPGGRIGDGAANTQAILANACQTSDPAVIPAALACGRYEGGGYDDWFLPSIGEALEMNNQMDLLGIDENRPYQLSSPRSQNTQIYHYRGRRILAGQYDRRSAIYVRPIRIFTQTEGEALTQRPQLLPFGSEGARRQTEVPTDGTISLEVIFVYFNDNGAATTAPTTNITNYWNELTSDGDLNTKFMEQGLGDVSWNVNQTWQQLPNSLASYITATGDWDYNTFIRHGHAKLTETTYDERTIFVMVPDKDVAALETTTGDQQMSSSAHTSATVYANGDIAGAKGIRSNIVLGTNAHNDDYRLLMHEIGHSFGSPDLYPEDKELVLISESASEEKYVHEVGGYGMMGDMRGATGFLGWHRYRYGWLDEARTLLVKQAGPHRLQLTKITGTSGTSMLVIPDPDKYAKLWVVEIGQEVKKTGESALNNEGDRLIVYTVEAPTVTGKREIRLVPRKQPLYFTEHLTTEWLDAYSYKDGQRFSNPSAPFTLQVLEKTTNGFEVCLHIPDEIDGGSYPIDETSVNNKYLLHFSSDGNVVVKDQDNDGHPVWDAKHDLFPWDQINNTYVRLFQGKIQLASFENDQAVREIELNAPDGSEWHITDEGKVQVKSPSGAVLWRSFPDDEISANGAYKLKFSLDGNIQARNTADDSYAWGIKTMLFPSDQTSNAYVTLKDGNIQLISTETQEMVAEIEVNAPEGSEWHITDEGKVQVKSPSGAVLWRSFPDDEISANGAYKLKFSLDGNIQARKTADDSYAWDIKTMLFPSDQTSNAYVTLKDGNIQLISTETQEMVAEIEVNAPEGSEWHITDEGKVQVKSPSGAVLWRSFPDDEISANGAYKLKFSLDGNIQARNTADDSYAWGIKTMLFPSDQTSNAYVTLKDGNIQLISTETQEMVAEIAVSAPEGSEWHITDEGKVQVVSPSGDVLWYNFQANGNSDNGTYTMAINNNDGNITISGGGASSWYGMQNLFPSNSGDWGSTYLTLNSGTIQLVNKATQQMVASVPAGGATGTAFKVSDTGKLQVVDSSGTVVWTNN